MDIKKLIKKTVLLILIICSLIASGCEEADDLIDPPSEEPTDEDPLENDFVQVTGSGYITLVISGLSAAEVTGDLIMYGASGIPSGQYERIGSSAYADSDTKNLIIKDDSTDYFFTGGDIIGNLGCIIDATGDMDVGDGDYYGGIHDHVINGSETVNLSFPGDFTLISGSGYITLSVSGLGILSGKTLMYGASGIPSGQYERIGNSLIIDEASETMVLQNEGSDFLFYGSDEVGMLGCIIDVNGNGQVDDGDFIGGDSDHLISGDETISLTYPDDFTEITGSGYITLEVTGLSSLDGSTIMYGSSGIPSGESERIGDSKTISSTTMTMILSDEGTNYLFTGGNIIERIGCLLDVNDNGLADDGDWVGGLYDHVMAGSTVLSLNYNPE